MFKSFLVLLSLLLSILLSAQAETTAQAARHRPRYTAYKHRGDARKRWRRMGVLGRYRYHRRYRKSHPKRGVIRVGRPNGTMPKR